MLYKHFIYLVLLFLFLMLLGCSNRDQNRYHASYIEEVVDGKSILLHLDLLFNDLSNIEVDDLSSVQSAASINEAIKEIIEKVATSAILMEIGTYYHLKKHEFVFAISNDEKLGVFSWDTRMGGEMDNIKNIALYTLENKVVTIAIENKHIFYNDIFKLKAAKNDYLYLFHGWSKSSKLEHYYRIDAYTIHKDKIVESFIFPTEESSITSTSTTMNTNFKSQIDLAIEKDGTLILKPEIWKSGVVYKPMIFDGVRYNYELLDVNNNIKEKDFERHIDFNFLKGSELPITIKEERDSDAYIFEDGTLITQGQEKEISKIFTSKNNKPEELCFELSGYIIGKHENYLFFSKGGLPENWLLTIYDINKQKIILSKYVAKAIIKKNRVLCAEFSKTKGIHPIENIDCNPNYENPNGYYTFYELQYTNENPLVLPIDQVLCSHIQ